MVKILSHLPLGFLYLIADLLGFLVNYVLGYRREVVDQNLARAFPDRNKRELKHIRSKFYRHFFQVLVETVKGRTFTQAQWQKRVKVQGLEKIRGHLDRGQSVIMMTGHIANWEWSGSGTKAWIDERVTVLYKKISNKKFEQRMLAIRKKGGLNLVEKDSALRYLIKTKKIPQVIGMVSDQIPQIGSEKYWMSFLNQQTAFFKGAEKFSKAVHFPVYYADMRKTKRGNYQIEVREVYDGKSEFKEGQVIKKYAAMLEATIADRPADYLWSHRRWKYNLEQSAEITGRPQIVVD
jgi:KDO2-lipid IV(A) lauroyltransferase